MVMELGGWLDSSRRLRHCYNPGPETSHFFEWFAGLWGNNLCIQFPPNWPVPDRYPYSIGGNLLPNKAACANESEIPDSSHRSVMARA